MGALGFAFGMFAFVAVLWLLFVYSTSFATKK
jgi:hypothetical protein